MCTSQFHDYNVNMISSDIDRKIAVIFATDVVGYSKHMEKDEDAKKLMFASFFYLPILQLIYVIDKLL